MIGAALRNLSLATIGAACALATVACFLVGIPFAVGSGVEVLIPETDATLDWIEDVDSAGGLFFVGAWLVVAGGFFGIVALVGFYDALRDAGPVMVLGPILGAVGLTLVTISHVLPIAMAAELVPGYVAGDAATKASLVPTFESLASLSLGLNTAGNMLGWGIVVPLYGFAILRTRAVARWIGWLGIFVGVVAGWLGLLSLAWSAIEAVTFLGFVGFFVFMASMGVALLRGTMRERVRG
jgi:hypothetical protein